MPTTSTTKVAFNETVQVRETLSLDDYTASEISAAWLDDDETDKITQRCFKILSKFENGNPNSHKYCMRGLEGHTTLGSISKRNNRAAAYAAVLDEQERQYENGKSNAEAISEAYRCTSSSCAMWAQVVGNRDQQAVEEYLYEDEEDEEIISADAFTKRESLSCVTHESRIAQMAAKKATVFARAA